MSVAVCPDRNVLQRLLLGQLDPDEASTLDQHLLDCERCCAVLQELEAHDTMADAVRAVTAEELPLDERVEAVMAHVKQATLPAKAFEETLARAVEPTQDAWELEKFLDPPEAEGELGRFGGYRVLRVLGAGGMGLVLEGEDPKLRRRVALKVMKSSLAARDEHHQRFLREARVAAAIEHPHIVTVHQVGEHRGLPFMAMQLLKGEALDERLRRQPALPLAECLRIGRETAEALAEAHGRNLIHRDIKPGNIWLEGTSGWVKLVDFGLAHAAEDVHLTQTGAIMGTPAYMSPEQARGETVDGRSDLYSLGAVLYKLTTGDVPFRGASTMAVLMALATEAPRRPSELNPDVPPALDDLILRLLAKKPDERFHSAVAVAKAIRAIEHDSPKSEVQSPKSGEQTGRRRPRWFWVAAAAAACFAFATIVIIVRDKDGNEVLRATVPDGGSATLTEGDTASKVAPVPARRDDGSASPLPEGQPTPPARSVEAALPEPPPLEEWLKGREVLTVAQDGSGQFKTIQAALDALQPGQVVNVLDRGPYRERLVLEGLPADTGLVSRAGTRIELSEWKSVPHGDFADYHEGHVFSGIDGFRLHGFELAFPQGTSTGCKLRFSQTIGLVLEHCLVRAVPMASEVGEPLAVDNISNEAPGFSAHVRDCLIEGYLELHAHRRADVTLVVEHNCFTSGIDHHLHFHGDAWKQVVVRHNVFTGQTAHDLLIKNAWRPSSLLEVSNNTTTTAVDQVVFTESAHHGSVTIRNNLCTSPCLLSVFKGAENDLAAALATWHVDHNVYPEPLRSQTDLINWIKKQGVPRSPADVASMPRFLSKDVSNRDYLRIAADGPLANGGSGGAWPDYIGALPPGPAPPDGDWFTRLREQWGIAVPQPAPEEAAGIPPPIGIVEPPSLEEWLKGRTVLTVAQDGSGQFKTIQAALDALRPGQAVEVLDRGPYRETLNYHGLPDTGLISRHGTVIQLPDTVNHVFDNTVGFRLYGFELVPFEGGYKEEWLNHVGFYFASGVVVEQCCFRAMPRDPPNLFAMQFLLFGEHGGEEPIFLRDCLIEGRVQFRSDYSKHEPRVVLERNWLRPKEFPGGAVELHGLCGTFVIRENVIERGADSAINLRLHPHLQNPKGAEQIAKHSDGIRLLIEKNTLPDSGINLVMWWKQVSAAVEMRNNLLGGPITFGREAFDRLTAAKREWHIDHNFYVRAPKEVDEFPLSTTDRTGNPRFANRDEASRDFLRPLADSPLASSGGQSRYIGALPPGPAPKDGDWFTRLRERWGIAALQPAAEEAAAIPPPIEIAEPPPLEEWLKGRTVLTVAQDGSGQFKTIQAALDALQPGQVVKVLDEGPYRERLEMEDAPADSGLVSDKGTVLELAGYA
ncbi:MAG TPA: protein kinase, partial [Pirellulales bacterium]|nr:protein kinase [Pirellulales bacterium]